MQAKSLPMYVIAGTSVAAVGSRCGHKYLPMLVQAEETKR